MTDEKISESFQEVLSLLNTSRRARNNLLALADARLVPHDGKINADVIAAACFVAPRTVQKWMYGEQFFPAIYRAWLVSLTEMKPTQLDCVISNLHVIGTSRRGRG